MWSKLTERPDMEDDYKQRIIPKVPPSEREDPNWWRTENSYTGFPGCVLVAASVIVGIVVIGVVLAVALTLYLEWAMRLCDAMQ
jgi:hypothetical protein